MQKSFTVGQRCSVTIFSGAGYGKREIYEVTIVELFAAVARVQLWNGNILRVCVSQLKHF